YLGDAMRGPGEDALAIHQNVAATRLIEPAEAVEERCLAGAVGSDEAEDLPLPHVERHAVQRDDAAEYHADVADGEQRACALRHRGPTHRAHACFAAHWLLPMRRR